MSDWLKEYANDVGLPIMNQSEFEHHTDRIGKEQFRLDLAEYIANNRPEFPLKDITEKDVRKLFNELKNDDIWKIIKPIENIDKTVFEKYEDYKYPFKEHGLGLIDGPSTYNSISNYFHQDLRLNCGSYGFEAPIQVWTEGTAKDIWKCLGPIWRGINNMKKVNIDGEEKLRGGSLNNASYMSAFRLGTYIATQFKPNVAKAIYHMTDAKKVLDTSCGWGDRLAGFYTSDAEEYIGCDPNPNTFNKYYQQIETYEKLLGNTDVKIHAGQTTKDSASFIGVDGKKKVRIYRCGAEDLPWDEINNVDCAFTSPPYFSTEEYNKGGEHEEDQSWFKFNEYEKWRDDFYLPVSLNSHKSLSENGFLFVNIMDPKIKGKRYHSCDELVDSLEEYFIGQIGMRIMQRPQGNAKFKTKEELNEFMNMLFIENVWCFYSVDSCIANHTGHSNLDLFRHSRVTTLDNFF